MILRATAWLVIFSLMSHAGEPIAPIPLKAHANKEKALIGKSLFFDPILSKDMKVSCASCHNFTYGGADCKPVSTGIDGQSGKMNAPTVLNASFNFVQFWNGRAKDLGEQALGPIHNPSEMGASSDLIERRLNNHQGYKTAFAPVIGNRAITMADVVDAIAEYEKTLITPNSKFDRYLRGEMKLDTYEARGYALFKRLGCASCHNGRNVGGNSYQKFGVIVPIKHNGQTDDRFVVTKRQQDKHVYKVPTLRNIALTAPYFHDGRAETLYDAVRIMSTHNLGISLTQDEIGDLVAFLYTLTGEFPDKGSPR